MRRLVALAIVLVVGFGLSAVPAFAGDEATQAVELIGGNGTADVPTSMFEGRPAWTTGYHPVIDGRGKLWLWARFNDSVVYVQPMAWKDRAVNDSNSPGVTLNYGVNLNDSHQAAGEIVTNDPEVNAAMAAGDLGTSTGAECPLIQPRVSVDAGDYTLPAAIVVGAVLVAIGLRRRST